MTILEEAEEEALSMAREGFTFEEICLQLDAMIPEETCSKIAKNALRIASLTNDKNDK